MSRRFLTGVSSLDDLFTGKSQLPNAEFLVPRGVAYPASVTSLDVSETSSDVELHRNYVFIVISGPTGVGKTTLATQIACSSYRSTLWHKFICDLSKEAILRRRTPKEFFCEAIYKGNFDGEIAFANIFPELLSLWEFVTNGTKTSDKSLMGQIVATYYNNGLDSRVLRDVFLRRIASRQGVKALIFTVDQPPEALAKIAYSNSWASRDEIAFAMSSHRYPLTISTKFDRTDTYWDAIRNSFARHLDNQQVSKLEAGWLDNTAFATVIVPGIVNPELRYVQQVLCDEPDPFALGTFIASSSEFGSSFFHMATIIREVIGGRSSRPRQDHRVVVVDSLFTMLTSHGLKLTQERVTGFLRALRRVCMDVGAHLIVTTECGVARPGIELLPAYAADQLIRLKFEESDHPIYERRRVSLEKSRYSENPEGVHDIEFVEHKSGNDDNGGPLFDVPNFVAGWEISPSLDFQIRNAEHKGRIRPTFGSLTTGSSILDSLLGGSSTAGIQENTQVHLVAEPGTEARLLALQFLAAPNRESGASERLYLSFTDVTPDSLKLVVKEFDFAENLLDSNDSWQKDVHIQTRLPPRISPERLLSLLDRWLGFVESSGTKVRKVVVEGFGDLEKRFPLLGSNKQFPGAVRAILLSHGTTPMFIERVNTLGDLSRQTLVSELESLAESIVLLGKVDLRGQRMSVLSTKNSKEHEFSNQPYELKVISKNSKRSISLSADSLEPYTDIFSGYAKVVPLKIVLYDDGLVAGDPIDQPSHRTSVSRHKYTIQRALEVQLPEVNATYFGPTEHSNLLSAPKAWASVPRPDTCVLEFDGYWFPELESEQLLVNLRLAAAELGDRIQQRLEALIQPVQSAYRVRHYADMGFLVERKRYNPNKNGGVPTWRQLASIANEMGVGAMSFQEWQQDAVFDFDRSVDEAKTCMLLELIYSALAQTRHDLDEDTSVSHENLPIELSVMAWPNRIVRTESGQYNPGPFRAWHDSDSRYGKRANGQMVDAIQYFKSLFPIDTKVLHELCDGGQCNPRARFSRQWYSTMRGWIERAQSHELACPRDTFIVHNGVPSVDSHNQAIPSVAGSWNLGIARGSLSVRLGLRAILEMVSREEDERKFRNFVGLPVGKWFYESQEENCMPTPVAKSPSPASLLEEHNKCFARAFIEHYRVVSSVLLSGFKNILRCENTPTEISSVLKNIEQKIRSISKD